MLSTADEPGSRPTGSRLFDPGDWIGSSDLAGRVRSAIATAALSPAPVLIEAEDGTGRRLAAELIHRADAAGSGNRSGAFFRLDAGGQPAAKVIPRIAAARRSANGNGTGAEPQTIYVSGVAWSSAADLNQVENGLGARLRQRLIASASPPAARNRAANRLPLIEHPQVSTIRIPPLRERKMDISSLALRFLAEASDRAGVGPYGISSRMIAVYHDYDWPGNVAELRAVMESAVSTAALARFRGRLLPDSFCGVTFTGDRTGRSLKEMLGDIEKTILENTLHRVNGNQTTAARILRVNTTTLHEKLKRHGLLTRRGVPHD